MDERTRCAWCGDDAAYVAYHDGEWGVPLYEDRRLFEMLILEGVQAGLSWLTVLKKRNNYRQLFDNFEAAKIARYSTRRIESLLGDKRIIRNRLKVESTVQNAQAFLAVQSQYGNFKDYIWRFVDGRPITNHWRRIDDVPVNTPASDAMSRDLKKRGFKFVGTTICYAYMQAVGMVNDHTTDCFRHVEIIEQSRSFDIQMQRI